MADEEIKRFIQKISKYFLCDFNEVFVTFYQNCQEPLETKVMKTIISYTVLGGQMSWSDSHAMALCYFYLKRTSEVSVW